MTRALFLAPHNDDETLFGAFTLLRYQPFVVVCFRSERMNGSLYPGGPSVDFQARERETACAMEVLGCKWHQWAIVDSVDEPETVESFMWGLRDPAGADDWDVVFAPAIEESGNHQHNLIGELAEKVFSDVQIVNYLTYTVEGRSRWSTEVEFEPEWVAKKLSALACYSSQAGHPATRAHFLDSGLREYVEL